MFSTSGAPSHDASWNPPLSPAFAAVLAGTISTEICGRSDSAARRVSWSRVIAGVPVEDVLSFQPRGNQLVSPFGVLARRSEQRPCVLGGLQ